MNISFNNRAVTEPNLAHCSLFLSHKQARSMVKNQSTVCKWSYKIYSSTEALLRNWYFSYCYRSSGIMKGEKNSRTLSESGSRKEKNIFRSQEVFRSKYTLSNTDIDFRSPFSHIVFKGNSYVLNLSKLSRHQQ